MLRTWWILTGIAIAVGIVWVLAQQKRIPTWASAEPKEPPPAMRSLEESVAAWQAAPEKARLAYAEYFVTVAGQKRDELLRRIDASALHRKQMITNTMEDIFFVLNLASLSFLLLPFFVGHRYPGRRRRLWIYTIVGVLLLVFSLGVFSGLLEMLRDISALASAGINPERGIVEAGFDYLEEHASALRRGRGADGPPLGPVVGSLAQDPSAGFAVNLLRSMQHFDRETFESAANMMSVGYRLLRLLPHIIPYLLLVLFFFTLRGVLVEIFTMPGRAASGEPRVARRAVGVVLKTLGKELLSLLVLLAFVLILTLSVQLCVRAFARGIVDWTVLHTESTVHYLGLVDTTPDRTSLFIGLLSVPACLALTVLCIAIGVTGSTFWARRVTQLRFHRGVKLRAHDGFWRKTVMSFVRIQWIPVLALWLMFPLARRLARDPVPGTAGDAETLLWLLAQLSLGSICVALVLFGGVRAALYFLSFRPHKPEAAMETRETEAESEPVS